MSEAPMTIHVFGKPGCAKCSMLNRRIDALLETEAYKDKFVKLYDNLTTEDGLVDFCLAQCVNPNRVPAMVIADEAGNYIENAEPGKADDVCGNSRLYQYLGIQTDYSDEGKGIIKPEMIEAILNEALSLKKAN